VGLVLAHMSQERAAVDVADRIQPRVAGHLEVLIDGQRFPWREPDCLQAEISGQGLAARGDQDLLAHDDPPVVQQRVDQSLVIAVDALCVNAEADVDT